MKIIGRFRLVSIFITPVRSIGCTSKLMKMWGESMIAGMEKKHVINLTLKERRRCLAIVSKGRNKASMIRRAHILLKSDEGKTDLKSVRYYKPVKKRCTEHEYDFARTGYW